MNTWADWPQPSKCSYEIVTLLILCLYCSYGQVTAVFESTPWYTSVAFNVSGFTVHVQQILWLTGPIAYAWCHTLKLQAGSLSLRFYGVSGTLLAPRADSRHKPAWHKSKALPWRGFINPAADAKMMCVMCPYAGSGHQYVDKRNDQKERSQKYQNWMHCSCQMHIYHCYHELERCKGEWR